MSRLAFLFGPISTGARPFNFTQIEDDPRGLTGTDGSFLGYASAMAARGHDVTLYCDKQTRTRQWHGCTVKPYNDRFEYEFDAAITWNDIAGLRGMRAPKRLVDMQVNDFNYVRAGELDLVTRFLAPSRWLADYLSEIGHGCGPWDVLPNGCDPSAYSGEKVPGRCIWASSPDRGLHVVLQQWPKIKAVAPGATLRIFYHGLHKWIADADANEGKGNRNDKEHARRARIVAAGLNQPDIVYVGPVSRKQMAREYSEAELLLYPCDTIARTEGFGVAVLEGCASGAVPVLADCDAFREVYGGTCPMVDGRGEDKADEWAAMAGRLLLKHDERGMWAHRGRAFAERHAWPVLGAKLEEILQQ
jgi:hypothetical protein